MAENDSREIGELSVCIKVLTKSIDGLRSEIGEDRKQRREWEERHDGQGDGTTHAIIDRRLAAHSMWINIMKGMGILLASLWAWLSSKLW